MAKRIRKSFESGDLTNFETKLKSMIAKKETFKVEMGGLTRKIRFDSGTTNRYFGVRGSDGRIGGIQFVMAVRRSIDRYIDEHGVIECNELPHTQCFNQDAINGIIGNPVACLDVNLCYWNTIYQLGFISETLFKKGLASGEKSGLVVSIGALNKLTMTEDYVDGERIGRSFDHETHAKYSPFYRAVICRVRDVMMDIYKAVGNEHFYMWLTDCAFIHPSKVQAVEEVYKKYGYTWKHNVINFVDVDEDYISWWDNKKAMDKCIAIGKRNIEKEHQDYVENINFQDELGY